MKPSKRKYPKPLTPRERADHAAWALDEILAGYFEADRQIAHIISPAIWQLVDLAKSRSKHGISKFEEEFSRHA